MSLLVTIVKAPESVALTESSKTFDVQGGTLGRGKDNTWVLEDPERYLSSRHCQFSHENGQFYITDLSTNGTFYNGSPNPMGKGTKLPLNDGDTFILGDYEFSVSLWSPAQQGAPAAEEQPAAGPFGGTPPMPGDDPFSGLSGGGSEFASSPFASGHVSSSDSLFSSTPEETDPLAALDKAQGGGSFADPLAPSSPPFGGIESPAPGFGASPDPFQTPPASDPFSGPSFSDQADPLNQQVSWPDAVPEQNGFAGGGIPDDWDDDLISTPPASATPAAPQTPPPAPAAPVPPAPSTPLTEPPVVPEPARARPAPAAPSTPIPPVYDQQPEENSQRFVNTGQFDATEGEISPAQQKALEKANAKIQAELEILKRRVNIQQRRVNNEVTVDTSLVDAMGLQKHQLVDEEITRINHLAGEVVREMVRGLMQVLGSRSSIKNEFRMNVTTIQPVENNPLKFSANVDDALENMFIKQGDSYKKPVEAVREGFEGVAEHQIAILAGIRAAFKGVIERFDPVLLEARFEKQRKPGLLPGSQKARNWDLFVEYYNELAGDIDSSFQYLFGDEFVNAYEDQLQKLAIAKKQKKTKAKKKK